PARQTSHDGAASGPEPRAGRAGPIDRPRGAPVVRVAGPPGPEQPSMPRLNVLFVVSECVPFAKTGGLADVAGALPLALAARGHDVRVVLPRYRVAKKHPATRLPAPFSVPVGTEQAWGAVYEARVGRSDARFYLLERDVLFDR